MVQFDVGALDSTLCCAITLFFPRWHSICDILRGVEICPAFAHHPEVRSMLPIHTILHPTDFSERSEFALPVACALARDYTARLVLLHVAASPTVYAEGAVPPDSKLLWRNAKEQLDRLVLPTDNVRGERLCEIGNPSEEILRVAGLSRLLMGSVAEEVVRMARCPVLTVKAPFPAPAWEDMPVEQAGLVGETS
jgi:nucleotide-binding universal stress UspA family protein